MFPLLFHPTKLSNELAHALRAVYDYAVSEGYTHRTAVNTVAEVVYRVTTDHPWHPTERALSVHCLRLARRYWRRRKRP